MPDAKTQSRNEMFFACVLFVDWGKYYEKNGKIMIPISVQVHHSFVEGMHVGKFVNGLQEYFDITDYFIM